MTDFSNYGQLNVTAQTLAEYVWDAIPGRPSLWLAAATDQNEAFQEARLRLIFDRAEQPAHPDTPEGRKAAQQADREADRRLLSQTCAKKWGTAPIAADGSAPEFTVENCYAFFKALPDFLFDPLRGYASNVYNFMPKLKSIAPGQADDLGN